MIKYYQERRSKDFLAVDTSTRSYYKRIGERELEGRATAIEGLDNSMCTLGIGIDFLKNRCKRVNKKDVPANWLKWINLED